MSTCDECGVPWTPAEPLIRLHDQRLCEVCWHAALDDMEEHKKQGCPARRGMK